MLNFIIRALPTLATQQTVVLQNPTNSILKARLFSSMPFNIIKQENGWTLEIQIVGYVKDELTISVENNLLKIASIEASVDNSTDKNYLRKEFRNFLLKTDLRFLLKQTLRTSVPMYIKVS